MLEEVSGSASADEGMLIPVMVDGDRAYMSVRRLDRAGDEDEIAARLPSFDEVVGKITAVASGAVGSLRATGASKVILEFGCEIGVEAGQLIAIIGKASGKSTFKIGLEWSDSKTGS